MKPTTERFLDHAKQALGNAELRGAVQHATASIAERRKLAVADRPDFEALRERCAAVKAHTMDHLDRYLEQLIEGFEGRGGAGTLCRRPAGSVQHRDRAVSDLWRAARGQG